MWNTSAAIYKAKPFKGFASNKPFDIICDQSSLVVKPTFQFSINFYYIVGSVITYLRHLWICIQFHSKKITCIFFENGDLLKEDQLNQNERGTFILGFTIQNCMTFRSDASARNTGLVGIMKDKTKNNKKFFFILLFFFDTILSCVTVYLFVSKTCTIFFHGFILLHLRLPRNGIYFLKTALCRFGRICLLRCKFCINIFSWQHNELEKNRRQQNVVDLFVVNLWDGQK